MSCRAGHRQDSEPLWLRRSPAAAAAWEPSSGNFHVLRVHPHMLTKRKKKVRTQIRKSERMVSQPPGFFLQGQVTLGLYLLGFRALGQAEGARCLVWPPPAQAETPRGGPGGSQASLAHQGEERPSSWKTPGVPCPEGLRDNDTGLPSPTLSTSGHGMWWPQRWFILIFEFLSCGQ